MTTRNYSSRSQQTTLTSAVTAGASTIVVQSGSALLGGQSVPAGTTFTIVIDPDTAIEEIVDVTVVSTNTLTITRAIDGSSAQAHSAGAVVRHMAIGRDYRESNAHIEASTGVHGISNSSSVVGTIDTQTLTNKTLTAPTITNPSISGAGVDASIVFEGATADAYETTLTVVDPTQDNTLTLPNTTGTIVVATAVQTLTNKTLTSPTISGSPVITGLSSAGMSASSATPKDYVDSILGSATAAATSAASAATSATSAATSATSAAASAVAAASSATASASSATAAATSATSAAASATAAATSATSSAASATTSQAWATQLVTPVSGTDYSAKYNANLAAASATSSATSATSSATSATASASSASAASTSASSALTSQTAAATSATSAAASATAAATSATSAAASATAAATSATSAAASATEAAGYVVPSQTGNAGKFLGTNGTAVSWGNSATSFIPTGSTVPTNGMYLSGTNTIGFATDSTLRMQMNASGNLSIGAGSSTNRVISMGKSITGNVTSYGILNLGAVQSDVTTSAAYYATSGGTQATAFTLGQLNHFYAIQGTLGLGSAVTNQMGYNVDASLIGATNNFGFYGNIPAGTNRWNTYMVGGAANYFNGQTSIGTTVLTLGSGSVDHQLGVLSGSASRIGMVIRGAASQTGDLLQIQNNSATVLANILSDGSLGAKSVTIQGSGGQYVAGSIYSDANWGMIFRAKQASPVQAQFKWAGSTDTEYMRIDPSGKVGIGNTSPTYMLDVNSTARVGGTTTNSGTAFIANGQVFNQTNVNWNYANFELVRNASNTATPRFLGFNLDGDALTSTTIGATNSIWGIYDSSPTTGSLSSTLNAVMGYGAYAGHRWYNNGTEYMRIASTGNVGIGTGTPAAKLDVNGSIKSDNLSGRNAILNSEFNVMQRGTSFGLTFNQVYTFDRWYGYCVPAGTYSRQATNDTTNLPNIQYCARVQRNNGNATTGVLSLSQSLETVNSIPFAGKTITFSFYARRGANFSGTSNNIISALYTGTGTDQNFASSGYTGQATPIYAATTLTTTWQRFSYTATLAATVTELGVIFEHSTTGTAGASDFFEVTGIQVELGNAATPYRSNQPTYQAELAACQRYYYRQNSAAASARLGLGHCRSTTEAIIQTVFPVSMRTAPTALEQTGTASNYLLQDASGSGTNCNAVPAFNDASTWSAFTSMTRASGLVAGNVTTATVSAANIYLGWSAEL